MFESCFELREAFELLLARPDKLALATGEMFPTQRSSEGELEEGKTATMEGVEHLGQYVFEMTKAKVEALKAGGGVLPPPAETVVEEDEEEVQESYEDGEEVLEMVE